MAPPVPAHRRPPPTTATPLPGSTVIARAGWLAPASREADDPGFARLTPHRKLADLPTWRWLADTGLLFSEERVDPVCVPSRRACLIAPP
jgi:hypothetical protein